MSRSVKRLVILSLLYLLSAAIGVTLSVQENLPAEFGGFLHGKDILSDFIAGPGTALTPPLVLLGIQIALTALLHRKESLQRIGAGGLMVLGLLYFFGQLGEPITWRNLTFAGFHLEQALVIAANLLLPLLMSLSGLILLRRLILQDGVSPN